MPLVLFLNIYLLYYRLEHSRDIVRLLLTSFAFVLSVQQRALIFMPSTLPLVLASTN